MNDKSSFCFCGNTYGLQGNAANCDMKCNVDSSEICGGSCSNSIFLLTQWQQSNFVEK